MMRRRRPGQIWADGTGQALGYLILLTLVVTFILGIASLFWHPRYYTDTDSPRYFPPWVEIEYESLPKVASLVKNEQDVVDVRISESRADIHLELQVLHPTELERAEWLTEQFIKAAEASIDNGRVFYILVWSTDDASWTVAQGPDFVIVARRR